MRIFRRSLIAVALMLLLPALASAQIRLNQTTLSAAVTSTASIISVTSVSTMAVGDALWVDHEMMRLSAISGTRLTVLRGQNGSAVGAHPSGAIVFSGVPGRFYQADPAPGSCTVTSQYVLPHINSVNGNVYHCINSIWYKGTFDNVGTPTGTGVYVAEIGYGPYHQTVFTFVNVSITVRDTETGGGQQIYTFPLGRIYILGSTGKATFTTTSTIASTLKSGVSCRWGVGTVTQSNGTLATTEQDILPVTTFAASTTINVANTATTGALAAAAQFDGTSTAKAAFLNVGVPSGSDIDANATVKVNGNVTISWLFLGTYFL